MKFPPLFIRADGNEVMGMGHLMRCLSLADQCKTLGGEVIFLSTSQNDFFLSRCKQHSIHIENLNEAHPASEDITATLKVIQNQDAEKPLLILDGYHFDSNYQDQIRSENITLLVIDDNHHLEKYKADFLLNQIADHRRFWDQTTSSKNLLKHFQD